MKTTGIPILGFTQVTQHIYTCVLCKCVYIRENTFKKQYANHKKSFNTYRYKNATKLFVE